MAIPGSGGEAIGLAIDAGANGGILDQAISRARAYAEAGADGIFAPGLANIGLIARLAEASHFRSTSWLAIPPRRCTCWRNTASRQ